MKSCWPKQIEDLFSLSGDLLHSLSLYPHLSPHIHPLSLSTLSLASLRCCGITVKGCSSLALALKSSHSSITELGLMGNDTGEEGLRILSDVRDNQRYKLQTLE